MTFEGLEIFIKRQIKFEEYILVGHSFGSVLTALPIRAWFTSPQPL
ncbi:MAG TPA: hypothetical protein VFY26_16920 [Anaerolineales bacterium]|nr:hypothetical protein [Anaerolineales bacterium]